MNARRKDKVKKRTGRACARCGRTTDIQVPEEDVRTAGYAVYTKEGHDGFFLRLTIDHIWEQTDGGSSDYANLQALCGFCHKKKTILFQHLRAEMRLNWRISHQVNKEFVKHKKSIETILQEYGASYPNLKWQINSKYFD